MRLDRTSRYPIRAGDRDCPPVPVTIARTDPGAARTGQAAGHILTGLAAGVDDQQVLLSGRGWCRVFEITDELK